MADIESDNIGENQMREQVEVEQAEEEETLLSEKTDEDIRKALERIPDVPDVKSKTKAGKSSNTNRLTNNERKIQKYYEDRATLRNDAIKALEKLEDTIFNVSHGEKSKELIDNITGIRYIEKGKLAGLKFKGEDIKLTVKGKLDGRSAKTINKKFVDAIEAAKVEYKKSADAVVDEGAGTSVSNEAKESVKENFVEENRKEIQRLQDIIAENDLGKNVDREIRSIVKVDEGVDYENLEDPNQQQQYEDKIEGLKININHFDDEEKKAKNPKDKLIYNTAKELCIRAKSDMEVKANVRPESEDAQTQIENEAKVNDLTRFERFKRWAKENLVGVSAIAISVAGIITTVVIAGRNAVKKGAKAVGQFGKALAKIAKKAGPAIATILNILAQALTWGAKALEFLSRNLWIVALFLTYLLYDSLKDRYNNKNQN